MIQSIIWPNITLRPTANAMLSLVFVLGLIFASASAQAEMIISCDGSPNELFHQSSLIPSLSDSGSEMLQVFSDFGFLRILMPYESQSGTSTSSPSIESVDSDRLEQLLLKFRLRSEIEAPLNGRLAGSMTGSHVSTSSSTISAVILTTHFSPPISLKGCRLKPGGLDSVLSVPLVELERPPQIHCM